MENKLPVIDSSFYDKNGCLIYFNGNRRSIVNKFTNDLHKFCNDSLTHELDTKYCDYDIIERYNLEEGCFAIIFNQTNKDLTSTNTISNYKIIGYVPTLSDSIYFKNEILKIKDFTEEKDHFIQEYLTEICHSVSENTSYN